MIVDDPKKTLMDMEASPWLRVEVWGWYTGETPAEHLREKMYIRDVTVTALAKELGITRRAVQQTLNDERTMMPDTYDRYWAAIVRCAKNGDTK